jgi:hypothetical protein
VPGTRTFTVRALDAQGRTATKTVSYEVVDVVPPDIDLRTPSDGATYELGVALTVLLLQRRRLAAYSCQSGPMAQVTSCSGDVLSGAADDTASVGAKTFTVHAADESGRTATLTHAYSVVYAFVGFGAPVSSTGALNDVKAGDPVPLKFSLAGDHGLSVVHNDLAARVLHGLELPRRQPRGTGPALVHGVDRPLPRRGIDRPRVEGNLPHPRPRPRRRHPPRCPLALRRLADVRRATVPDRPRTRTPTTS